MAASVTHTTPADGTFSTAGAAAWNAEHTLTGVGDVSGPASATNNHLAVFDGVTGKLIKDGGAMPTSMTPTAHAASHAVGASDAITPTSIGADAFHGIQTSGNPSWSANVFTLATSGGSIKYWYQGVSFTTASAITLALTPTNNTLYYIYFTSASGVLTSSTTAWDLSTAVPVATLFYNGTTAAIVKEMHNHTRSLDWHKWAHLSIGARYQSGMALSGIGGSGTGVTFSLSSGNIFDEDLNHTIAAKTQATTSRKWRPTSASAATFLDTGGYPFFWNSGTSRVQYVDNTYALVDNGNSNNYTIVWVYAIGDTTDGFYFFTTPIASPYTTVANARAASPPDLSAYGLNPEMKLCWRLIISGGASPAIQASTTSDDFRTSSTVPSGGTSSPSAASVTETNYGNVQTAINTLIAADAALAPIAAPSLTGLTTVQGLKIDTQGSAARGAYYTDEVTATIASTKITVDWTLGNNQVLVMSSSLTGGVAFTAPSGVAKLTLRLIGDGNDRGVSWVNSPDNIEFGDNGAPVLKYTSGFCNVICFMYDNHATTPKYFAVASTGFESATTA